MSGLPRCAAVPENDERRFRVNPTAAEIGVKTALRFRGSLLQSFRQNLCVRTIDTCNANASRAFGIISLLLFLSRVACGSDAFGNFSALSLNRCGAISLDVCATFLGATIDQKQLDLLLPSQGELTSYAQLSGIAAKHRLTSLAVRWAAKPLLPRFAPAILAVRFRNRPHFVAALGRRGNKLLIVDFPNASWITCERLRDVYHWDGSALHVMRGQFSFMGMYMAVYWQIGALVSAVAVIVLISIKRRRSAFRVGTPLVGTFSLLCVYCCVIGCGEIRHVDQIAQFDPSVICLESSPSGDGSPIQAQLLLNNLVDTPIIVKTLSASCGCVSLDKPSPRIIEPGASAIVPIGVKLPHVGEMTVRVVATAQAGPITQAVSARLILRGRQIETPSVLSSPREVALRLNSQGQDAEVVQVQTYEDPDDEPWITGVESDRPFLDAMLVNTGESTFPQPDVCIRSYDISLKASAPTYQDTTVSGHANRTWTAMVHLRSGPQGADATQFVAHLSGWAPIVLAPKAIFVEIPDGMVNEVERRVSMSITDDRFTLVNVDAISDESWVKVGSVNLLDLAGSPSEAMVVVSLLPTHISGGDKRRALVTIRAHGSRGEIFESTVPIAVKINRNAVDAGTGSSKQEMGTSFDGAL